MRCASTPSKPVEFVTAVNFTFGSVIEEQASPAQGPPPDDRPSMDELFSEEFGAMRKAMDAWQEEGYDTIFDTGVRILINGIQAEPKT